MDPFVVTSFGKKVFRTRVVRHSFVPPFFFDQPASQFLSSNFSLFRLNPTWEEKLLFHVRQYETNFTIQVSCLSLHAKDLRLALMFFLFQPSSISSTGIRFLETIISELQRESLPSFVQFAFSLTRTPFFSFQDSPR